MESALIKRKCEQIFASLQNSEPVCGTVHKSRCCLVTETNECESVCMCVGVFCEVKSKLCLINSKNRKSSSAGFFIENGNKFSTQRCVCVCGKNTTTPWGFPIPGINVHLCYNKCRLLSFHHRVPPPRAPLLSTAVNTLAQNT